MIFRFNIWLLLLFIACSAYPAQAKDEADASGSIVLLPKDVYASYEMNILAFKNLNLEWIVKDKYSENAINIMKLQSGENFDPFFVKPLRHQMKLLTNHDVYQFYGLKMMEELRGEVNEGFKFPSARPTPDNLKSVYPKVRIAEGAVSNVEDGVKVWNGIVGETFHGSILARFNQNNEDQFRFLPPLAANKQIFNCNLHPYDQFFQEGPENTVIESEYSADGDQIVVLMRKDRHPPDDFINSWLSDDQKKEFASRITKAVNILRVHCNMNKGAIPVLLERNMAIEIDGRELENPFGEAAFYTIESLDIQKVENGGYYPVQVIERTTTFNFEDVIKHDSQKLPVKILLDKKHGKPSLKWGDNKVKEWIAVNVSAPDSLAGYFGLKFPEETTYFDYIRSTTHGVKMSTNIDRTIDKAVENTIKPSTSRTNSAGHAAWLNKLIILNVVLVTCCCFMFYWNKKKKRK